MDNSESIKGMNIEEKRKALAELLRARARKADKYPLTDAQFGMWVQQNLDPSSTAYNMPLAFCLHGRLRSVQSVEQALTTVIERHAALRTVFSLDDGEPRQSVVDEARVEMPVRDMEGELGTGWQASIPRLTREQAGQPFDLATGPLYRFELLRVTADLHILLTTFHHIVMDGWCIGLFLKDFAQAYMAYSRGQPLSFEPLPATYRDYAIRQNSPAHRALAEADLDYWQRRLDGAPSEIRLPIRYRRRSDVRYQGATYSLDIPPETAAGLANLTQAHGVTSFMLMLATFQVFLARICDQDDIVLGVSVSNRDDKAYRSVIGLLSDVLPMRARISMDMSFAAYLSDARVRCLEDYDHSRASMTRIIERVRPERRNDRNLLFQAGFDYQNTPWPSVGNYISLINGDSGASKLDLNLNLSKVRDSLSAVFEYNTHLFPEAAIAHLADGYLVLLESVATASHLPIGQLALVRRTRASLPGSDVPDMRDEDAGTAKNILAYVREHASSISAKTALQDGSETTTYAGIEARTASIAAALIAAGARPGDRIGLVFERSAAYVLALLGVARAGGVYVPMDPALPESRRDYILADAGIRMAITSRDLLGQWMVSPDVRVFAAEDLWEQGGSAPVHEPAADDTAYIIYTSGTTGRPKGVMVGHGALAEFARLATATLGIRHEDRVLQFASVSFDTSAEEIFPALLVGATLVFAQTRSTSSVQGFLEACTDEAITVLNLPTAFWHEVVDALSEPEVKFPPDIRLTIIGGEAASAQSLSRWLAAVGRGVRLLNTYGPTETTVSVTATDLSTIEDPERLLALPIGQPYPTIRIHILDRHGNRVPQGVYGEIMIGGPTLAQGYNGMPDMTAAKFVRDPFGPPGTLMYRTGDYGRFVENGAIEFAGRRDDQVKLSGFRVELAEIETILSACPGVTRAVVLVMQTSTTIQSQQLRAFLLPETGAGISSANIKAWSQRHLPHYMLPASFEILDAFPVTVNGKIDRAALAEISPVDIAGTATGTGTLPRNQEEAMLASIWANILSLETLGVHDNFFELGGHSLLLIRMLSRVRSVFGVEVPMARAFESSNISDLAMLIADLRVSGVAGSDNGIARLERLSPDAPMRFRQSLPQQSLWFIARLDPASTAYNNPSALRIDGELDAVALETALAALIRRQEILRTVFADGEDAPVQIVLPQMTVPVRKVDLSALDASSQDAEVRRQVAEDAELPFDLVSGPLLRVAVLDCGDDRHVLMFNWHHIITDAWTLGLFLGELAELYRAVVEHRDPAIRAHGLQYADFSEWQWRNADSSAMTAQLDYWKRKLADAPRSVALPVADRNRAMGGLGRRVHLRTDRATTHALSAMARSQEATLFMVCLTAFKLLLWRYGGQSDIVVGTPISGRSRQELENVFGYFINTLVLRTELSSAKTFKEAVALVRKTAVEAYGHQSVPFERLVREFPRERDNAASPLFNVSFVLENRADYANVFPGTAVALLERGLQQAKFGLTLSMRETDDGIECEWEHPEGLFEDGFVETMSVHYGRLLKLIAADPLVDIRMLDPMESETRAELLAWGDGGMVDVSPACLHETFERCVDAHPDVPAIVYENAALSYAELEVAANRLAHVLRGYGIGPDVVVGICLPRSLDLAIAILAVWKAGGAYMPIDPEYPPARGLGMLEDSDARVLLTHAALAQRFAGIETLCLDTASFAERCRLAPDTRLARADTGLTQSHMCYVIFTSGSTGRPKGVIVEHRSLMNLGEGLQRELDAADVRGPIRWAWNASVAFDASLQALLQLSQGSTLHLLSEERRLEPAALARYLREHRIDVLDATPLQVEMMLDHARDEGEWPLLVIGGDAIGEALWSRIAALSAGGTARAINVYGPTETTVDATAAPIKGRRPNLGRPLANVRAYVVGPQGQLQPPGVPGELWIGGAGPARGYAGREELTAERFTTLAIDHCRDRVYRTGDTVRWSRSGVLEFIGRNDDQAKIRGRRVEIGEIEARLREAPGVSAGVVLAREDGLGGRDLVAYVVPSSRTMGEHGVDALREHLAATLPDYMVPAYWVALDALPMTVSGKLNRALLPAPVMFTSARIAPSGDVELRLARIWSELLRIDLDRIGADTNFLLSGGHSLLTMRLLNAVRAVFGLELSLKALFEAADLRAMAAMIAVRMDIERTAAATDVPVEEAEW
jgi:amino acid adenylation domain-containing protein